VKHYLKTIELKNAIEQPNLKEAIYFVKDAWDSIDRSVIENCWRHCNIVQKNKLPETTSFNVDDLSSMSEISEGLKKIAQCNIQFESFCSKEFVEIDNSIPTGETLTTHDIINLAKDKTDLLMVDDDEETENAPTIVTPKEALLMLGKLKNFFEQSSNFDYHDLKLISNLEHKVLFDKENKKVQTKLNFN
jgi:hypothetical protein